MIALVANRRTNVRDVSDIVDSARLVVRVGKMCSLDSGMVGTRTDWVAVAPNGHYYMHSKERRHWDQVERAKRIFIRDTSMRNYMAWRFLRPFVGLKWERFPDYIRDGRLRHWTTTAQTMAMLAHMFPDEHIVFAAGDIGQAWSRTRKNQWHGNEETHFYDKMILKGRVTII